MKLSVIVCTHNPREDYLQKTLDALRGQTLPKDEWELLLIDNSSTEPLSDKWDLSWHLTARHIREEELGLTPARLRGISESVGETVVFVDDDNLLSRDYLQNVKSLFAVHTRLGCIGTGCIKPEFEEIPSTDLLPFTDRLALRVIPTPQWSNSPKSTPVPWGAGLAVRRVIAEAYFQKVKSCSIRSNLDRKGMMLTSGGDDEFSWIASENGYGIGVFPELNIIHLIDKKRTNLNYLLKITEGHGYSQVYLAHLHSTKMPFTYNPSKFIDIIKNLLRLRFSRAILDLKSWWEDRNKPLIEKKFHAAWRIGVESALKKINKSNS